MIIRNITDKNIFDLQKLLEPNRIAILMQLFKQETCVCEMVKIINIKHNLLSHHLKTLIDMGYIESTRHGHHIIYNLTESKRDIISNLFEIIKYEYHR